MARANPDPNAIIAGYQGGVTMERTGNGQWRAYWTGVAGRTYFIQTTSDLKTWKDEPAMRHGAGVSVYDFANQAPSLFIRLRYVDIPTTNPEDADFDGDGLSNIMEVTMTRSDPLAPSSRGLDSDRDGLPDGWEMALFGSITSQSGSDDPDGDHLTNLAEYQLRLDPKVIQKIGLTPPVSVRGPLAGTGTANDPVRLIEGTAHGHILQWSSLIHGWTQVPAPPFLAASGPSAAGKSFRVNPTGGGWILTDPPYVDVCDHGAIGNGITDDTAAIRNAVAAAKKTNASLLFPAGKTFRITDRIVLDARTIRIDGHGSILRCVGNTAGIYVGSHGMATMQLTIIGLEIIGDGCSGGIWKSDNQILIDCHDSAGKNITLRDMRFTDGKIAFRSRMTDYLQLEKILWRGNGTHWHGGFSTNVSFARGCAFIGKNSSGEDVTDKHCHFIDVDTCIFLNSEFGDGKYGLYLDSTGPGVNNMVTWKNCRTERVKIRDIQVGTGAPGANAAIPVNIVVEQSVFMGLGASDPPERTHMIEVNRCTNFIMRDSYGNQMKPGSDLVRIPDAAAGNSTRLRLEHCGTTAGCYTIRFPNGTTSSNQLITYGMDGSATEAAPFGLPFRAADIISSNIEIPVAIMPRAGNRTAFSNGANFVISKPHVSDAANYWTIDLRLRVNGEDQGLPVFRMDTLNGQLSQPFVSYTSATAFGTLSYLNARGVIVLRVTKTGNPPPLEGLCGTLFYEPTSK
jgi:hypothetical protein